jgi:hypothetical protein
MTKKRVPLHALPCGFVKGTDTILGNHLVWVNDKEKNCTYQRVKVMGELGEKAPVFPPLRLIFQAL